MKEENTYNVRNEKKTLMEAIIKRLDDLKANKKWVIYLNMCIYHLLF